MMRLNLHTSMILASILFACAQADKSTKVDDVVMIRTTQSSIERLIQKAENYVKLQRKELAEINEFKADKLGLSDDNLTPEKINKLKISEWLKDVLKSLTQFSKKFQTQTAEINSSIKKMTAEGVKAQAETKSMLTNIEDLSEEE